MSDDKLWDNAFSHAEAVIGLSRSDNVGGLVAKWREAAKQADAAQGKVTKYGCAYAVVFRDCADELEAALSAHGQPVDYSPALHSVLSYIAYGECDEEGLHPGLFATVKEKIDKLRSKPVVDEAMAQKFWDGYEQYFVDLSADELFDGKDRKIEAAMSALTAALGATA